MSSIQELREKRTAKAREYRNLLDRHPESIPEEAANQFDALETARYAGRRDFRP